MEVNYDEVFKLLTDLKALPEEIKNNHNITHMVNERIKDLSKKVNTLIPRVARLEAVEMARRSNWIKIAILTTFLTIFIEMIKYFIQN